jgi:hypothetical protein
MDAAGISVLRDGTMRGGGSVLYHFGSYHCSDGKWKGEVTCIRRPLMSDRLLDASPAWDLPERIPMRVQNSKLQRSWASEASD